MYRYEGRQTGRSTDRQKAIQTDAQTVKDSLTERERRRETCPTVQIC
jgi:hypothetical protein